MFKHKLIFIFCIAWLVVGCDFTPDVPYAFAKKSYTSQDCESCVRNGSPLYTIDFLEFTAPEYLAKAVNPVLTQEAIYTILDDVSGATDLDEALDIYVSTTQNAYPESSELTAAHELDVSFDITYRSKHLLSIQQFSYLNAGGAHGNSHFSFINVDAQTGARITLNDLTKDKEGMYAFAKAEFIKIHGPLDQFSFPENTFTYAEEIGFTDQGILMYYNTYEIAPYVMESQELLLPWEAVEDFMTAR